MMYSEFVEGTGCRDNEKNYAIFQGFEMVYMNSDISKEEIYKMAKKMKKLRVVNNDLTEEQKKHNEKMQHNIEYWEERIQNLQTALDTTFYSDTESIKYYKNEIKIAKKEIQTARALMYKIYK